MKSREKVLVVAAATVAIFVGYGVFRYKPRRAEIKQAISQANSATDRLQKLSPTRLPARNPGRLQRQLAELRQKIADEKQRLTTCRRFLTPGQPEGIQRLRVLVSELAARTGVRIRENTPYELSERRKPTDQPASHSSTGTAHDRSMTATSPFVDPALVNEICQGSLQRLVIEAPYANLRDFFDGLNRLPSLVTVVSFDIQTTESDGGANVPQSLSSVLILAM